MRTRKAVDAHVAEVTSRRLEALIAELAAARAEPGASPSPFAEPPLMPARPARDAGAGGMSGAVDEPPAPDDEPRAARGRHARRPVPAPGRAAGWVGDRLPVAVRGGVHLGSAQLGLVALVVSIALVLAAWSFVRSSGALGSQGDLVPPRPDGGVEGTPRSGQETATTAAPSHVGPSTDATSSASPLGQHAVTGSATGPPSGEVDVVVDVAGKVRRPGIAVLPAGSRVVDAVEASGGARPGVDLSALNLARVLVDGEQVVVGEPAPSGVAAGALAGPSPPAGAAPSTAALVNLNAADQAALETLPGVGPVTAAAILQWRTDHGSFTSVDELLEISGIGDATLAEIAPHVTL